MSTIAQRLEHCLAYIQTKKEWTRNAVMCSCIHTIIYETLFARHRNILNLKTFYKVMLKLSI